MFRTARIRFSMPTGLRIGLGAAIFLGLASSSPTLARADLSPTAQPMTFYVMPPADDVGKLTIISGTKNLKYTVTELPGTFAASGEISSALAKTEIGKLKKKAHKITTSDVAYLHFGSGKGGQLHFPAEDGTTLVGSAFPLLLPDLDGRIYAFAHTSAKVSVIDPATGITVETSPALTAAQNWVIPTTKLVAGKVYRVVTDSKSAFISLHQDKGGGFKPAVVGPNPEASCHNDVGASGAGGNRLVVGLFSTNPTSVNRGLALVKYSDLPGKVTIKGVSGSAGPLFSVTGAPPPFTDFLANQSSDVFFNTIDATTTYRAYALWGGDTSAGTIDSFGDFAQHLGWRNTGDIIVRVPSGGATLFASEASTNLIITKDGATGAPTAFTKDSVTTLDSAKDYAIRQTGAVSRRPILVQSYGSTAPVDFGGWLRPVPLTDSDGDGFSDFLESFNGGCQSVAPDTDGDGTPDFLDADSDNDCLADSKEGTDANRTDPTKPKAADANCVDAFPDGSRPVCTKGTCNCTADSQCKTGKCDTAAGVCVAPPPDECKVSADCKSAAKPVCNTAAIPKTCVGCLVDTDCKAADKVCNTTTKTCEAKGPGDTGPEDTGPGDTGPADTSPGDTGLTDTGSGDTGSGDTSIDTGADTGSDTSADSSVGDTDPTTDTSVDSGVADTLTDSGSDIGTTDSSVVDSAAADTGTPVPTSPEDTLGGGGISCAVASGSSSGSLAVAGLIGLAGAVAIRRRRRN